MNNHHFITTDFHYEDFDFIDFDRYALTRNRDIDHSDSYSLEELYEMPLMNCIRYYPSYVSFEEEDRYQVDPNTTLLYDYQLKSWGIGMTTGGGMDLTPHLIDTFIKLAKGIPLELAQSVSKNNAAYISKDVHLSNCEIVAEEERTER